MAADGPRDDDVRREVDRRVRRSVGFKVLRDLDRWAAGVEREQRQRPKLVLLLLLLVALVSVGAAALVYFRYRGF